ncbi:hypothetical protein KOR42_34920 [Thalassoglobus neptunius]|uniref:FHA domain-containing protein n=2 Tax=Thalassoglobus neptunius TaxID=1938619 RepID=A0A5C5WLE7_9PLAN|nr:hypothetical protein KOR42_34920 [Thalassoglobus neptunius]
MQNDRPAVRLWIDGVGCWLISRSQRLTVGSMQPASSAIRSGGEASSSEHIGIFSDLRSRHASFSREDGSFILEPRGRVRIGNVDRNSAMPLSNEAAIQLGDEVVMKYCLPSPLSGSARLTLESGHRFANSLNGIILLEKTCLLGAGSQSHIVCKNWQRDIVIFERANNLFCKVSSRESSTENGSGEQQEAPQVLECRPGEILSGEDWSFHVEAIDLPAV